jgi:ABC-type glycerol-3-phosphate transport system substrate-binding protein
VDQRASSAERISGVKTFFTKLHPGALEFLDEQISGWLKDHPDVHVKHTNITTGEVQAKKTEPNIIITLWY